MLSAECLLLTAGYLFCKLPFVTSSRLAPALYVVSTPIGNLEDITLRALRVLKEAAVIACEDTRQTQKLLNHFGITTKTISYHEHNEQQRAAELIVRLEDGDAVAVVSDAGTPGVSDPGYRLIQLAIRHKIPVVPVPGASALLAALVSSGLGTDDFRFGGFLPAKHGLRKNVLESLREAPYTVMLYEAPHRIVETLEDIVEIMGPERRVVIARELTKLHEEILRGPASDLFEELRKREAGVKGEIVLLIDRAPAEIAPVKRTDARTRLAEIMRQRELDEKSALKVLAKELGVSKSEAYREVQRTRGQGLGARD
jgi:16S rRNA (cytidine1402-2'-O)-methyltransferase